MSSVSLLSKQNLYQRLDSHCMRTESNRVSTFADWPCPFLSPISLAKAGFYYTKKEDVVKCAYCGVEIGKWEQGDDILKDHKRWSPNCAFLRSIIMPSNAINDGEDTCGKYGIEIKPNSFPEGETCTVRTNLQRLLIQQTRGPTYPKYAIYDNRLLSFTEWPRCMKQKPADLADAGFFYTGKGDQTLCFHCGGGLKDWEEDDVPWEQHAIWFPKCNYLLLKKSQEYVDQVNNKKQASEEASTSTTAVETVKKEELSVPPKPEVSSSVMNTKEVDENTNSATLCKICYAKEVGVVFLPCGHVVACVECAPSLTQCAMCRKPLEATFRAFLS